MIAKHHVDGVRTTTNSPSQQRVDDLVLHARQLVEQWTEQSVRLVSEHERQIRLSALVLAPLHMVVRQEKRGIVLPHTALRLFDANNLIIHLQLNGLSTRHVGSRHRHIVSHLTFDSIRVLAFLPEAFRIRGVPIGVVFEVQRCGYGSKQKRRRTVHANPVQCGRHPRPSSLSYKRL